MCALFKHSVCMHVFVCLSCFIISFCVVRFFRHDGHQQDVKIALVGKYIKLEDAYISVIKALQHAALACRHHLSLIVSLSPPPITLSLLLPPLPLYLSPLYSSPPLNPLTYPLLYTCNCSIFSLSLSPQKVESDDLENKCYNKDPIKYHDAWKSVCSAE